MNGMNRRIWGLIPLPIMLFAMRAEAWDSGYMEAVTASQPVAYFRLSETSGKFYTTGNAYTGTPTSVTLVRGPGPSTGGGSSTLLLNGLEWTNQGASFTNPLAPNSINASSYIMVTNSASLDVRTNSLTLEAWVNIPVAYTNHNQPGNILCKCGDNTTPTRTGYLLDTLTDTNTGVLYVRGQIRDSELPTGDAFFPTPSALLSTGVWHHVAAVFVRNPPGTPDTATLYLDGVVQGTTNSSVLKVGNVVSGSAQDIQSTKDLAIGCFSSSTPGFGVRGYVDEPAIYLRALSAAEISNHWAAAKPTPRPGLFVPVTNNLLVALQSGATVTNATGRVAYWLDSASAGGWQDFSQMTNAWQPAPTQATMPSSRPCEVLDFTAANTNCLEMGSSAASMDTNTWSWFIVFKPDFCGGGTARILMRSAYTYTANPTTTGASTLWGSYLDSAATFNPHTRTSAGGISTPYFTPRATNQWFVMAAVWNGTAGALNGNAATSIMSFLRSEQHVLYTVSVGTSTNNASANPTVHLLTRIGANSDYAGPFDGQMAEILIYNTALSAADVERVLTYLEGRYLIFRGGSVFKMR